MKTWGGVKLGGSETGAGAEEELDVVAVAVAMANEPNAEMIEVSFIFLLEGDGTRRGRQARVPSVE